MTLHGLVQKYGSSDIYFAPQLINQNESYSHDFYSEPVRKDGAPIPKYGNILMLQLVIDGMKLQPCYPTFLNARDAIILADRALTGGKNECTLWEGFASRGLAPNASSVDALPWGGGVRVGVSLLHHR